MAKNYYIILGLSSNASPQDIRSAYRRLAKEYHPDHYGEDSSPFLEIQEAYSVLSDPQQRRTYDESRRPIQSRNVFRDVTEETLGSKRAPFSEPSEPQAHDMPDVFLARSFNTFSPSFDEIFDRLWRNFSSMQRPKSEATRPLTAEVVLSPEQAREGGRIRVYVPAEAACPTCKGRGNIGPWECWRCAGEGRIEGEYPIMIDYPPGIGDGHTTMVRLDNLGIRNMYLTVLFRISANAGHAL